MSNMIKIRRPSFEMAIFPVANIEYEEFDPGHGRCEYSDHAGHPVVNVLWCEAVAYCEWLSKKEGKNYRLPTEAEWEYAASGGVRKYPWGDEPPTPDLANYNNTVGKTTPMGTYPDGATPEGLQDMAGNVWEWCQNRYEDDDFRVFRGGAFSNPSDYLRCADRYRFNPQFRYYYVGFRIVRDLEI